MIAADEIRVAGPPDQVRSERDRPQPAAVGRKHLLFRRWPWFVDSGPCGARIGADSFTPSMSRPLRRRSESW